LRSLCFKATLQLLNLSKDARTFRQVLLQIHAAGQQGATELTRKAHDQSCLHGHVAISMRYCYKLEERRKSDAWLQCMANLCTRRASRLKWSLSLLSFHMCHPIICSFVVAAAFCTSWAMAMIYVTPFRSFTSYVSRQSTLFYHT